MQQDNFQPMPKSLKYLVALIVLVELVASAGDYGIFPVEDLRWQIIIYAGLWPQYITQGWQEFYSGQKFAMFFSHAFVHGSLFHMAMNTVILLALGKRLSVGVGSKWVLTLFFVSAGVGGVLFVLLNGSGAPAVGASGAVFGFFGFWKVLEYRMLRRTGAALTPVYQFVAVLVGMNVAFWFVFDGMLAWEAHLGGFIAGWLLGLLFRPNAGQVR
ncbi:MAG: rhomboid family intramembrane serine protease [Rhodobacteraceae bacterium]|nr:rhomboid family intramembrane serine protease [Paracoccaceae bacterium]